MAKCIRIVGQGVPVRMSDDDAFHVVVRDGDGEYCSKEFWARWYNTPHHVERGDKGLRKLVGDKITPVETLHRNLQHSSEW